MKLPKPPSPKKSQKKESLPSTVTDVDEPSLPPLPVVTLPSERKKLDRAIQDKRLSLFIADRLPEYVARLDQIAMKGDDRDSIRALEELFSRLLGKPIERQEVSLAASSPASPVVFIPAKLTPIADADGKLILEP